MFRSFVPGLFASLFIVSPVFAQEPIALGNDFWRVSIDPATFAISVTPAGLESIEVSRGVDAHQVSEFVADQTHATWSWDNGAHLVSLSLAGRDLIGTITAAAPGDLAFLDQPASGRGLILPIAEGHYVPAGDRTWLGELEGRLSEANTTQDLSLPLWGVDHDDVVLSWLLTNPYNNTLSFAAEGKGVNLRAGHTFTPLDPSAPFTFILNLSGPDLIAGAKRYREHLVETGAFEPMAAKIAATPEAQKLIGATHVYLWGSGLIAGKDVTDWDAFARIFKSDTPLAVGLQKTFNARSFFSPERWPLEAWEKDGTIIGFNDALDVVAHASWMDDPTDAQTLVQTYADLRAEVASTFDEALTDDPSQWGSGETLDTIEAIRRSGLQRLWIGYGEGWTGGLWHPEAVASAIDAGYLIAPYDSYQDAMKPGVRMDWASSHLGISAHEDCAVILADGKPRSGFRGEGHYTTPDCVRPILDARIRAIAAAAGFNSWFLDSYAAGMLFDSYRPGAEMTMAENAAGNAASFEFVNETLGLPTGSEDGNATTAGGILFGHGMETPYIGWPICETHGEQRSPYDLGGWWPPGEPTIFFKTVPLPEHLRTIHFDPAYRLPLYQAVFNDSVISTHHWNFDSLKFEGVESERELAQLLYNVPGLFHLSAGSLNERLPLIVKQDAFFRPLHERLWDDALTGFALLSEDRLVQETTFADGTRIVANFAGEARTVGDVELAALSVIAVMPDGATVSYAVNGPSANGSHDNAKPRWPCG
jgi:hypothetical protein